MARNGRMKKLAALVGSTPEALTEVIGDVFRETINELQACEPRAGGRLARSIRRHRRGSSGDWG